MRILQSNTFRTRSNFVRITSEKRNRDDLLIRQDDEMVVVELFVVVVLDDHQVPHGSVVGENIQSFDQDWARAFLHHDQLVHTSVTRSDVEDVRKILARFNRDDGQSFGHAGFDVKRK